MTRVLPRWTAPVGPLLVLLLGACVTVTPAGPSATGRIGAPASGGTTADSTVPSVSDDPSPAASPTAGGAGTVAPTSIPDASPAPIASVEATPPGGSIGPETPVPSASPDPRIGASVLLLLEDFSDPSSGWGVGERDNGSIGYETDHLRVDLVQETAGLWSTRPLLGSWEVLQVEGVLETTATGSGEVNGYAGFLCAAGQRDFFVGLVDTRGGWVLAESVDTAVTVLARSGPPPAAVSPGVSVRLSMRCAGSDTGAVRLRLLVDGQEVGRFERAEGLAAFDQIGVYGEAAGPSFSFRVETVNVHGGREFVDRSPTASPVPSATASPSPEPSLSTAPSASPSGGATLDGWRQQPGIAAARRMPPP